MICSFWWHMDWVDLPPGNPLPRVEEVWRRVPRHALVAQHVYVRHGALSVRVHKVHIAHLRTTGRIMIVNGIVWRWLTDGRVSG